MSNRFRSVQVSSDGESIRGGRLLQVTNTCEAAVGERVQCCDRENSGRAFVRSEMQIGSATARLASFEGKSSREPSTFILTGPPIDSLATIELFCRRLSFLRVRILQRASVMLGRIFDFGFRIDLDLSPRAGRVPQSMPSLYRAKAGSAANALQVQVNWPDEM